MEISAECWREAQKDENGHVASTQGQWEILDIVKSVN